MQDFNTRELFKGTSEIVPTPGYTFGFAKILCRTNPKVIVGSQEYFWVLFIDKLSFEKFRGKEFAEVIFGPCSYFNLSYRGGQIERNSDGVFEFTDDTAREVYLFDKETLLELHRLNKQIYGGR